jgi:NAD(P)H dehydrogenase (quinone)
VSWTAHADLAEAAAIILAQESKYDGPTPPLTGAHALNFSDLAKIAADVMGKPFQRKVITDDELKARVAARGAPESVARIALGFFIASRNGEFAAVDPTLGHLLGRPLTSMQDIMLEKMKA